MSRYVSYEKQIKQTKSVQNGQGNSRSIKEESPLRFESGTKRAVPSSQVEFTVGVKISGIRRTLDCKSMINGGRLTTFLSKYNI